jgi:hypothetical protein
MKVGNPSSGGARKKKNYFFIGQGSSVFRILPPMGNLAEAGVWSKYYAIHFGYENVEGYMRPFQSSEVKNRTNNMIEVDDPAKDRIEKLKSQLAAVQERNKTNPSGALEAKIEELNALVGFKGQYNLEKRHYVNAMNEKGEIGLLGLKHKEKLALDEARTAIKAKYGIDVIGVEGAFIEFNKSGRSFDTLISARGHMILQADQSEKLNRHTVDDALIGRLESEAFELDNLYVALSRDEIETIVKASEKSEEEGKKAVTAVFAKYQTTPSKPATKTAAPKAEVKAEAKSTTKVTKPVTKVEVAPDLSMDEEEVAPVEAAKASAAVVANQTQSDDDFLASIGVTR